VGVTNSKVFSAMNIKNTAVVAYCDNIFLAVSQHVGQ
jgi:hypothetical protein